MTNSFSLCQQLALSAQMLEAWPHYYFARGDRAEYGYVCVSPPVPKGPTPPFPLPPLNKAGGHPLPSGGWPTKRPPGGAANVPAELLYKLSLHSFFFFPWWFMLLPLNLSLAARGRRRRTRFNIT